MSIGVGIITCNRPDFFKKCLDSIDRKWFDYLVVVNDGDDIEYKKDNQFYHYIKTSGGEGVGKAKNKAFKHLLGKECDYIILVEDDMLFKGNIFEQYINAYKKTGIEHFMFGYHGPANKGMVSKGKPLPRKIIDYHGGLQIALNEHCVGAVCFYTRNCLEKVGLFDESFTNAFEHVDHSFNLAKQGFTTPYWWWPDIANSLDYVEEQACSEESSAIRPRKDWQDNIGNSWDIFERKHGIGPTDILDTDFNNVSDFLKIKKPKEKISFIIHFRKDTEHRMVNLDIVYKYYKSLCPNSEFIFVEDDSEERIKHLVSPSDKYIFFKNDNTYNKCKGYNIGLDKASNDIICFLDIDCLVSIDSIIKSISLAKKDMIVIGYNGTAVYIQHALKDKIGSKQGTELFKYLTSHIDEENVVTGYYDKQTYCIGNTQAVGGCLIGKKSTFKRINGFNPNFIGWGYEDNEIISRSGTLKVPVARVGNNNSNWFLLHLPHEEGGVAIRDKDRHDYYLHNEKEVQKVEAMSEEELEEYIESW
jgi:GT2 family glycosyltransferase